MFLSGLAASVVMGTARADEKAGVTFLVVSDVHYRPGVFPHDTHEQLEKIVARGVAAKVDFGIQLGDFQHNAARDRAFIDVWNNAPFETHHVIGNHDDDATRPEETCAAFRLERGWYAFDRGGFRFVVLDTNWAEIDGSFIHYGKGCGFAQWKLPKGAGMRLHPDEFPWLEEMATRSPYPCFVFSHRPLAGTDADAVRVRGILSAANRAHPGRVLLALCGHNHCDRFVRVDGVGHWTVNSPNHCWVPLRHAGYPVEDMRRWKEVDHIVAYDGTPLCAIVRVSPSGAISVQGQTGAFWRGLSPSTLSPRLAKFGVTPSIRSFRLDPGGDACYRPFDS